ncbi:ribosome maturation factor RimM [Subtercola endophyticus]|uniref:ribosome maturation factor RimM n=1 Tax=Subtercola endophyticus TaxID=2895559 RepID=UPI001E4FCE8B|nr:ribosome maturation factor RimM [Subtercola endophyticus]UFS60996.1 ribosome maturation factor RimM [Subtercola endophyticus]
MASAFVSTWLIPISKNETQLRVGRLTKAHGLKGAIKLELFTDDPGRRFVPGAVFTLQVPPSSPWHGKTLELSELRWYNGHPVGFFVGVPDRTAAESLAKAILWIDHDLDEKTNEEDAWFDHQLVGLGVIRDGVRIGSVSAIDHLSAQDLLHVSTDAGEVLVPFVKAIVSEVDIDAGTLTVTPPPGLFEELPASEAGDASDSAAGDADARDGVAGDPDARDDVAGEADAREALAGDADAVAPTAPGRTAATSAPTE